MDLVDLDQLMIYLLFSPVKIYNGLIEAAATLLGAVTVLAVGYLPTNWSRWGDLGITLVALCSGLLLFFMSITEEIWVAYIGKLILILRGLC